MSQAESPGEPWCCAPSQCPSPVARRTLPLLRLVPGLRAPTGPSPRGTRLCCIRLGCCSRREGLPSVCETRGCTQKGDVPQTLWSSSHAPLVATGPAADTAQRPNRGLHPRPRPLCPTRGEQPMSGGEAEGIPGQEETGAAAAPELLPRIPDVALSTCPVLWGQAASPVLTAGPRGGPLRLQVAHQRWGSAPGREDGWHSCSPSPAPGHHGSQQGPPGPGPVSVTGWCGLAEGMSPAGLAPGPGEIRHLSQEHKGGSQGRGTAACQACAGPLWPIISEVPAAPCQVGLLPLNR